MIPAVQQAALSAVNFNPAPTPDDVWRPSPHDVPEIQDAVVKEILSGVGKARTSDHATPLGVAMLGRAGSGKTHLLGAVRERIQRDFPGYFFLVNLINGKTFWESTALGMVRGLAQETSGFGTQLKDFLRSLLSKLGLPSDVRDAIAGTAPLSRAQLDQFIRALRTFNNQVGKECQDTARALVLNGSLDFEAQDVGFAYLISEPGDPAGLAAWGFSGGLRKPQQIVSEISQLLALTLSPSVIALDQLDTLFAQTTTSMISRHEALEDSQAKVVGPVADGILTLRDITRRTLLVISCLPDTWVLLKKSAPTPVRDRFRETDLPDRIPTPEMGRQIIVKRFAAAFAGLHFSPPYETWPIKAAAFDDAVLMTPRALVRRVDSHIHNCLVAGVITELDHLSGEEVIDKKPTSETATEAELKRLDDTLARLKVSVDVSAALHKDTEDAGMRELLNIGLETWIQEHALSGLTYKRDPLPGAKPALHGRLIQVTNEATENEEHWAFRAIANPNAISVISRVKSACTMAGLDRDIPQRRLVLLRNIPWPNGKRSAEIRQDFEDQGGRILPVSEDDLRTFAALKDLRATPHKHLQEWLTSRRPAGSTAIFQAVLPGTAQPIPEVVEPTVEVPEGSVQLGYGTHSKEPFFVNVESLRRHTVVFAGSGSGKTVLIRRLIEECALEGVSTIVLDPNNDLARLGDPWPEPPVAWGPGDDARAGEYLANTEVVVWTPRVTAGRPLTFQPLPDFGPVRDSADEFDQAVRSAVEALAPRAGVNGKTKVAQQGKAVLTEALMAFAKGTKTGLREFADFLADLPDGVSQMAKAGKLAGDAAETLKAAMVTDPLFGGHGTAADPGVLLTPSKGKRARVSVISFVGLSTDAERQSFVNQLQMALFAWIKRHPAGERPLGGLFVMDEAQTLAPSTGNTPCTASTIALASQARKYGLGLVFATQAPKGLHNQISGNATTQFFGLLNAPAQIDAARTLAQAKGGNLPDIGLLNSGQFYAAGEGFSFVKVNTPLCLSYHPKAPLTPEDVVKRAHG